MAIYRFEAKVITRGSGRSAVASASYRTGKFVNGGKSAVSAAAYRAGAELIDERTGQRADYTNKRGVLGAEIMVPTGAVPWMQSRQQLWNAVERIEKRRDAQLARDFILTLPHELSQAQRVTLTQEFVREQFCDRGFVADIAWHAPSQRGDDRNYHAHVMVPMRRIEGDGFTRLKDRPPGDEHPAKAWAAELERLRVAFAETANRHLAAAGLDIRIDHRSLAERGVDREPEPKQGPLATQIERQGRASLAGNDRREVQARNGERTALRQELAAGAAEEARITDLVVRRLRSDAMKPEPLTEAELRQQHERELDALRQLHQQRTKEQFERAAAEEAEEAKRTREQTVREEAQRRSDGEIASASARYKIALGDHYDVQNPYGSLARAAMADYGAFIKEQDRLRQAIGAEPDGGKRQLLELRQQIEGCDWMAASHRRNAGISATIAGREDAPQAMLDRERAKAYAERSATLRTERGDLVAARDEQQRQAAAQQPSRTGDATPPKQDGRGQPGAAGAATQGVRANSAASSAEREAERGAARSPTGSQSIPAAQPAAAQAQAAARAEAQPETGRQKENREERQGRPAGGDQPERELSEAQRAKLQRLKATTEAYTQHDAQRQQERDRGSGGRSR